MRLLGISAFYHDSAAALLEDGIIVAAAQEERFSRRKHDAGFPRSAAAWCLAQATGPLDAVVYYEKPLLKFERILSTSVASAPFGLRAFATAMPEWLHQKLWLPSVIEDELRALNCANVPIYFSSHHEAHAASAFFPSPFARAAILTLDGVGEWTTTAFGRGVGNQLHLTHELRFPHSLGLLYSAFTQYCGFRVNSGEYKLMGLAPYGEPRFTELIRHRLLDLKPDGSFRLNLEYFGYLRGVSMTNERFTKLFGAPARRPDAALTQHYCDVAHSIQDVTEEIVLRLARTLHLKTGEENLCLAGGVALNCVANGRLLHEGPFRQIWIQPAAGDAGGALGAALAYYYANGATRTLHPSGDAMNGAFLGPSFSDEQIAVELSSKGLPVEPLSTAALVQRVVDRLVAGDVVGLFDGRAEYGPRALGARSILADARSSEMQRRLNLKIKFRESFRPFAPVVLAEHAARWFDLPVASPYMLFTAPISSTQRHAVTQSASLDENLQATRSTIPAVTHVDYSARIQTVDAASHLRLREILTAFNDRTGCPLLVNTSFNVRGEPPVCHPREAIEGFLATEMDCLAIGTHFLERRRLSSAVLDRVQPPRQFAAD